MVMEVSMGRWSYSPLDMTSWEDQTYLEGVLAWTLDLGEEGRWVTGKAVRYFTLLTESDFGSTPSSLTSWMIPLLNGYFAKST